MLGGFVRGLLLPVAAVSKQSSCGLAAAAGGGGTDRWAALFINRKTLIFAQNHCAMPKLSPLGYSDFKKLIEGNRYYVDKTRMIRAVVDGAEVQLYCRPRRFGKTLNLSMLRYFFDCEGGYRHLFEGLAAVEDAELLASHQGKYPVIYLSFKDEKAGDYLSAVRGMAQLLHREWARHGCLEGTAGYDRRLALMEASIESGEIREDLFRACLLDLSRLLHEHYGAPAVILIDEYDSPLMHAWLKGYYETMVEFMRPLLSGALKDNTALFKGVLTGILRVAKESLFSGLNNFISDAGLKPNKFADKFGFTEAEVATMLEHYGLNGRKMEMVREWYDGYRYGGIPIYNPWSMLCYMNDAGELPSPYWVNTGGSDLLKRLFFGREANIKPSLEALMRGQTFYAQIDEFLTFRGLETNPNAVLSLLYFAGYLRAEEQKVVDSRIHHELAVPNKEIRLVYDDTVLAWFREDLAEAFGDPLLQALLSGDVSAFGARFAGFVLRVFSYYDTAIDQAEHFYHAFLLGLIARLDCQYRIRSNGESGLGRYDICLIPRDTSKKGIVMEIKAPRLGRKETLEHCMAAAREQIEAGKYDTELSAAGIADVLRLAIAVDGKAVLVEEVGEGEM